MFVAVTCPRCGNDGSVPNEFANRRINCKKCGAHFRVSSEACLAEGEATALLDELSIDSLAQGKNTGIRFNCALCSEDYFVDEALANKTIKCRNCLEFSRVPGLAPSSAISKQPELHQTDTAASLAETSSGNWWIKPRPLGKKEGIAIIVVGLVFIAVALWVTSGPFPSTVRNRVASNLGPGWHGLESTKDSRRYTLSGMCLRDGEIYKVTASFWMGEPMTVFIDVSYLLSQSREEKITFKYLNGAWSDTKYPFESYGATELEQFLSQRQRRIARSVSEELAAAIDKTIRR